MKFLIQTIDGKVKHDFSFTLLESIEFHKWLQKGDVFKVRLTEGLTMPNYIPIGSVDFVCKYLQDYYGLTPKPINIPIELMELWFTGRTVINGTEKDIHGKKFVKSNDKIKAFTEICADAPVGNYQISDLIDIKSEWRAFVYGGEMVGLQNYSGDFTIFPNVPKIKEMIKAYTSQPIAFTLDVAVISDKDTVIIEVHDFFSCGLYGFADHRILPYMFSKWFSNFVENKDCR